MPEPLDVNGAIDRGLAFLTAIQEPDGSFISFSSASMQPFRRVRSWQTVFVPALMLNSLADLDMPAALSVRKKLAAFLLRQKNNNWSFNYWAKEAPEYIEQSYPNDLDDTFCTLAGLYRHDLSLIDAKALAKIVKLLLATEKSTGGPYRTWLVPADSDAVWLDVDLAVNSNIAYFLSLVGNPLPKLNDMMGRAIAKGSMSSPYYPSKYAFVYYLARAYQGPKQSSLIKKVLALSKAAQTDLDTALCLSARLQMESHQGSKVIVQELLKNQLKDGSWPAAVFYADPVKNSKLYYNGAPALTTAFVLEALQQYQQNLRTHRSGKAPSKLKKEENLQTAVTTHAEKQCRQLGADLRKITIQAINQTADSNNGAEIICMAQRFNDSLLKPVKLPPDFIEMLGLANLYGWTAYTIYDDFLDEEGKPEMISAANVALRRSLDCFQEALPSKQEFNLCVRRTFDTIDGANAWELAHCRFAIQGDRIVVGKLPAYGNLAKLAERSIGHALPVLAVLMARGLEPDNMAYKQTLQAIKHYLIARQLNDDAHDWAEDLQNGHITLVTSMLLEELNVKPGNHSLQRLIPRARKQFWNTTLSEVCQQMERHLQLSRQLLDQSALFKPESILGKMLDNVEESVQHTLSQQRQAREFLTQYKRKVRQEAKS